MVGLKHYPDKPWERHPNDIASWDNGRYICQQKTDGWRLEVCKGKGDDVHYITRHNKLMDDSVEPHIQQQMKLLLAVLPERSQLDGEWLSRRAATNKKAKPRLVLFDVIRYDKRWLLRIPYQERWALLQDTFAKIDPELMPSISLAETADAGQFVAFYEAQKSLPHSEGVVVKHIDSTLIADRKESKKNPRWYKVKFRQGSDGNMTMDHLGY